MRTLNSSFLRTQMSNFGHISRLGTNGILRHNIQCYMRTLIEENNLQRNSDSDLGKWLLCRLMVKQGYSEADVAKHMEKNETLTRVHPNLDEDTIQNMEAFKPAPVEFSGTL